MKNLITRLLTGVIMLSAFAMPLNAVSPLESTPNISSLDLASVNSWTPELSTKFRLKSAKADETPEFVADLLDYARTFTGLRYRRGGKTPKGFDCSGFTGYVFRQFGMTLGASSRDQYRQGVSIERDRLQPGDLVFFGGSRGGTSRVGHVGIVTRVGDDGKSFHFIHSACSSGITESHSSEPYYSRRYIGARRVAE